MPDSKPHDFDPLGTDAIAERVAEELLRQTPIKFPPTAFKGGGVYALFHVGTLPLYRGIPKGVPIYVGKSDKNLRLRLTDHAKSIKAAQNLNVGDFECRVLLVRDIWAAIAEEWLLAHFEPLWNKTLMGFGNHDPGGGRRKGARPEWDTVHPGRRWAELCAENPVPKSTLEKKVAKRVQAISARMKP